MKNTTPTYVRNHSFNDKTIKENVFVIDRLGNPIYFGDEVVMMGYRNKNTHHDHKIAYRVPDNNTTINGVFIEGFMRQNGKYYYGYSLSNYPINIEKSFWLKKKNWSFIERYRILVTDYSYKFFRSISNFCDRICGVIIG